ncbi:MAG: hypothetical protein BAJALOKI2v1_820018 [Promethearchaeota archaeon]|nr:MAG: hypothetical protein BAJALOKI2v1_820018 [Candidatus Lokiarchaeota archaeon]
MMVNLTPIQLGGFAFLKVLSTLSKYILGIVIFQIFIIGMTIFAKNRFIGHKEG